MIMCVCLLAIVGFHDSSEMMPTSQNMQLHFIETTTHLHTQRKAQDTAPPKTQTCIMAHRDGLSTGAQPQTIGHGHPSPETKTQYVLRKLETNPAQALRGAGRFSGPQQLQPTAKQKESCGVDMPYFGGSASQVLLSQPLPS